MKKWLIPVLLLGLSPALANAMVINEPDGSGVGYYGGDGGFQGGDVIGAPQLFDVLSLTMVQSGSELNVSILTNFDENSVDPAINDPGNFHILYGDLMIATTQPNPWQPDPTDPVNYSYDTASNTGTTWNYVITTPRLGSPGLGNTVTGTGDIYSSPTLVNTSSAPAGLFDPASFRADQYILLASGNDTGKNAIVEITETLAGPILLNYKIQLADILPGPDLSNLKVAVRWTMTCANDIVEGMLQLVSEPETLVLFLGGLMGLWMTRRSKLNPGSESA